MLALAISMAGCGFAGPHAAPPSRADQVMALLPTDVLLIGEQHDAPDHQRLQRQAVQALAERHQLAALVMEMADAGRSTDGLPRQASPGQVQQALAWQDNAWPWERYAPVVMAAVQAGVPVLGGNLPRPAMRDAMRDSRWDAHLPGDALRRQYQALRDGHCGLLPESQIPGMARIQIARDASMARVAAAAQQPGRVVVLVAGSGHVVRSLGIPTHWPKAFRSKVVVAQAGQPPTAGQDMADLVIATPALPPEDHCAALQRSTAQPSDDVAAPRPAPGPAAAP
ncbi:MAG: hypothetical protein EOO33_03235 [Comamonadaceae bacterium]|nr:MAG: hypothetical protein EOO33_03235 [Comamonadaceae bacterium]